jgi:hypothetical protein
MFWATAFGWIVRRVMWTMAALTSDPTQAKLEWGTQDFWRVRFKNIFMGSAAERKFSK